MGFTFHFVKGLIGNIRMTAEVMIIQITKKKNTGNFNTAMTSEKMVEACAY